MKVYQLIDKLFALPQNAEVLHYYFDDDKGCCSLVAPAIAVLDINSNVRDWGQEWHLAGPDDPGTPKVILYRDDDAIRNSNGDFVLISDQKTRRRKPMFNRTIMQRAMDFYNQCREHPTQVVPEAVVMDYTEDRQNLAKVIERVERLETAIDKILDVLQHMLAFLNGPRPAQDAPGQEQPRT